MLLVKYVDDFNCIEKANLNNATYVYSQNKPSGRVDKMEKKLNTRLWLLMHLKRAGVPGEDLPRLYFSLVRPVLEFAAPAFHPILTAGQANRL